MEELTADIYWDPILVMFNPAYHFEVAGDPPSAVTT
jgi:hypothetical protein